MKKILEFKIFQRQKETIKRTTLKLNDTKNVPIRFADTHFSDAFYEKK